MKARHLMIGVCALCAAGSSQGQTAALASGLLNVVTAQVATIDAWTIGRAMGYMFFSPDEVYKVWPDYGYALKNVKEADLCSREMLSLHSDFSLGKVSIVAASKDGDVYQGVTLYPNTEIPYSVVFRSFASGYAEPARNALGTAHDPDSVSLPKGKGPVQWLHEPIPWKYAPPDKNALASWGLEVSDLCLWLEGSAYSQLLNSALESVIKKSDMADLLIVTDRVIPHMNLEFDKRFEIQPVSESERLSQALERLKIPPS